MKNAKHLASPRRIRPSTQCFREGFIHTCYDTTVLNCVSPYVSKLPVTLCIFAQELVNSRQSTSKFVVKLYLKTVCISDLT